MKLKVCPNLLLSGALKEWHYCVGDLGPFPMNYHHFKKKMFIGV